MNEHRYHKTNDEQQEGFVASIEELKKHYAAARAKGDQQNMEYFARQIQTLQNQPNIAKVPKTSQSPQVPKNSYPTEKNAENNDLNDNDIPFGEPVPEDDGSETDSDEGSEEDNSKQPQIAPTPAEIAAKNAEEAAQPPQQSASQTPASAAVSGTGPSQDITPGKNKESLPEQRSEEQPPVQRRTSDKSDQIKEQLSQQGSKELKKSLRDQALKLISKKMLTNPYFWAVVIVVFLLIVVIALFAYFTSSANSGANGKTPVQAASSIDNKTALEKLALLSGNANVQGSLSSSVLTEAITDLTNLLTQTTNNDTKSKINDALTAAQNCAKTPPDTNACGSLPDKIKAVLLAVAQDYSVVPVFSGQGTHLPIDENKIKKPADHWANANWSHGHSISHHGDTSGHDLYLTQNSTWSKKFGFPTGNNVYGEAIDLLADNGTKIYAPFSGKVEIVSTTWEPLIIVQSDADPRSVALLGNIDADDMKKMSTDKHFNSGDEIGTVINGHLHFELWINSKPINAGIKFNKPAIWANMKKALKQP